MLKLNFIFGHFGKLYISAYTAQKFVSDLYHYFNFCVKMFQFAAFWRIHLRQQHRDLCDDGIRNLVRGCKTFLLKWFSFLSIHFITYFLSRSLSLSPTRSFFSTQIMFLLKLFLGRNGMCVALEFVVGIADGVFVPVPW